MRFLNYTLIITSVILLFACSTRQIPAPVINVTSIPSYIHHDSSRGSDGDVETLDNNKINVKIHTNESKANFDTAKSNTTTNDKWLAPTNGKVIRGYTTSNKGIDYTGKIGQDIVAVSNGKVLYSGTAKGYGNLIIIKHDKSYLTAYAFNLANLVKSGDVVHTGQKIASMGGNKGDGVLHFELRTNGVPINPNTKININ